MLFIDEKLNYLENKKALLTALPFYEFLLSIEKTYQKNDEFCSFNYEYNQSTLDNFKKIQTDNRNGSVALFNRSITVFPTNKNGIKDYTINCDFLSQIGSNFHNLRHLLNNNVFKSSHFFKKYRQDFESVLEDFSHLQKREKRFELYAKHIHGKIPEYAKIINKWKRGDVNHVKSDHDFLKYGKEVENARVVYQGDPEKEVCEEIEEKVKKLAHCKYPLEVANFAGKIHFIMDKATTIKDSPLISYMNIQENEANFMISKIEEYLILGKINKENVESVLNKKKRL